MTYRKEIIVGLIVLVLAAALWRHLPEVEAAIHVDLSSE
jgi:hypothetical protein